MAYLADVATCIEASFEPQEQRVWPPEQFKRPQWDHPNILDKGPNFLKTRGTLQLKKICKIHPTIENDPLGSVATGTPDCM